MFYLCLCPSIEQTVHSLSAKMDTEMNSVFLLPVKLHVDHGYKNS